ncbi:hypothetical protein [Mycolicibacterium vaccae]|uniref:hypothetical protein n=1 Tax=Mycolicibacterium vaccae TaxID=1810 RepID=UPI003CFEAF0B
MILRPRALAAMLVVSCAVIATGATHGLPAASAFPNEEVSSLAGQAREIPWPQLGLPDQVELIGADQAGEVDIPMPSGVTPTVLTGLIGSVVNTTDARLDVLDSRGVTLGVVPIGAEATTIPLSVDISGAQIADGQAALKFVLRDRNSSADSCSRPPSLVLSGLASGYSGPAPDPATVAGFLPGYLGGIRIHVGPDPTPAQTQAALDLVARLTHLYNPVPVPIDVDVTAEVPPPGPDVRVITVRDGGEPGVALENPGTPQALLAITGTGDELVRQVALFSDERFTLAQTDYARAVSVTDEGAKTTTLQTFRQLGMGGDILVQGAATLYAGFDAGAFGVGSISNARVHLKAHYTPVISGTASVTVRSGSTIVATRALDGSGVLDVIGDIRAEAVTSNTGMAMEIRYLPEQECAPRNDRLRFTIDPDSTVVVTPGLENRGGFQVLPMAFSPEFDVTLETPQQLGWAAQALNLMSQNSRVLLRPRLNALADAVASKVGLLAVGSGESLTSAGLAGPLAMRRDTTVDVNGTGVIDVNGALGAVQAFTQNDRTVLAITGSGDWQGVAASLSYIRGLPNRWHSLSGDVVAAGPGNEVVNLTLREGTALVNEYPGDGWKWWALGSAALVVVVMIGAATYLLGRRQRLAGAGPPVRHRSHRSSGRRTPPPA